MVLAVSKSLVTANKASLFSKKCSYKFVIINENLLSMLYLQSVPETVSSACASATAGHTEHDLTMLTQS